MTTPEQPQSEPQPTEPAPNPMQVLCAQLAQTIRTSTGPVRLRAVLDSAWFAVGEMLTAAANGSHSTMVSDEEDMLGAVAAAAVLVAIESLAVSAAAASGIALN